MSEMLVDLGGGRQRTVDVTTPSNSIKGRKPKPEPKVVEKVTVGEVTQRKKPLWQRVSGSMVVDDGPTVTQYIVFEVLLPAAKNMISDAVSQGVDRLMFGDSRPNSRNRTAGTSGYTNYSKVTPLRPDRREMTQRARSSHDFDDIVIQTRGEAEEVLDKLRALVDQYEMATVSDLYDLVGVSGDFTDDKWGWYDLRNAGVRPIRAGYLIVLPRPQALE
jgi:hypothetical protein